MVEVPADKLWGAQTQRSLIVRGYRRNDESHGQILFRRVGGRVLHGGVAMSIVSLPQFTSGVSALTSSHLRQQFSQKPFVLVVLIPGAIK